MQINRAKNAINGTIAGLLLKILNTFFPFIIRTIFIYSIGVEYLGLNSLFSSILQVLNLSELGIGSAIIFSMYKPIVDDDKVKICKLLNLYRYYYRLVGLGIMLIGGSLIPFLTKIIKGDVPNDINIYILYIMQLGATVLSYWLFAYMGALFDAHQRVDIQCVIGFVFTLFKYIFQILVLLVYKNYYLYLAIDIISGIIQNVFAAFCAKKKYPDYRAYGELSKAERHEIGDRVKNLFTAKVGGVVNHSADVIVISSFLGLKVLAEYQNYYYIVSTVMALFFIFLNACRAGIGNRLIVKSQEDNRQFFYKINYIVFFLLNICCSLLLCLFQLFMEKWVGKDLMLEFGIVILMVIYLYAEMAPRTMIVFKDAGGIWKEDRFRPLTVSIANLFINLILVNYIGLYGVLISTIVAMLFIGFPWLTYNIDRTVFKINIKEYFVRVLKYTFVIIVNSTLTYYICSFIEIENFLVHFILKAIICSMISISSFLFIFRDVNESQYLLALLLSYWNNKMCIKERQKMNIKIKRLSDEEKTFNNYIKKYKRFSFNQNNSSNLQQNEANITRWYHTIEKGLAFEPYKVGFGRSNVINLIEQMETYADNYDIERFAYSTALSTLFEYVNKNSEAGYVDKEIEMRINNLPGKPNGLGGMMLWEKPDTLSFNYEDLVKSRHSVRRFSGNPLDIKIVKEAIDLAQYTPSACNRQGWKCYIVQTKSIKEIILSNQNGNRGFGETIDKLLVVVGDLRCFNQEREVFQVFIDGGMYAMRIIDSLYYKGIAACPLSASLTTEQEKNVRKVLGMDEAEVLIMFIGVGNYPDEKLQTTKSERHTSNTTVI